MSAIVEVFKIKPFDLEPIYDTWPSAPIFLGNPSRDLPVDDWLTQIKEGCVARRVPKEYWHKVAQHYLGPHAKARFDELKAVMRTLHGGRYMWNWKRFKCAMRNMGWEIDVHRTEEIKVERKPSGVWWIVGGRRERAEESDAASAHSTTSSVSKDLPALPSDTASSRPVPKKSMTWDFGSFKSFPNMPKRSNTMTTVETVSSISTSQPPPYTEKTSAQATLLNAAGKPADPQGVPTEVAHAPTWLLNASQALGFLTTEHPKAMTAISAVLITLGSIPALPAIATGAGGAFLAGGTAQAIGSIAVGVGSLISAINTPKGAAQPAAGAPQKA